MRRTKLFLILRITCIFTQKLTINKKKYDIGTVDYIFAIGTKENIFSVIFGQMCWQGCIHYITNINHSIFQYKDKIYCNMPYLKCNYHTMCIMNRRRYIYKINILNFWKWQFWHLFEILSFDQFITNFLFLKSFRFTTNTF